LKHGPIDDNAWPQQLVAHVATTAGEPRVAGFDVESDLAQHYGFAELALIALTGTAPSKQAGQLLDVTLMFLATTSVAEAPAHAAVLARICGAPFSGMLSCGLVTLAEQARNVIERHDALLRWLADRNGPLPQAYRASSAEDRNAVERYRQALAKRDIALEVLAHDPSRTTALLAGLHQAGAQQPPQLQTLWVMARMGVVAAEGLAAKPLGFRDYPMQLPQFRYQPHRDDAEGNAA